MQHHLKRRDPELAHRVHFFNTFFFSKLRRDGIGRINYSGVARWTKAIRLFGFSHIVIPIHEANHWYVAIISHPACLLDKSGQCTIIVLDSMNQPRATTIAMLQKYLGREALARENQTVDPTLFCGVVAGNIPRQPNSQDCGLFLLAYLEKFTQDPGRFVEEIVKGEKLDWTVPNTLRGRMHEFLMALHEECDHSKGPKTVSGPSMADRTPISYLTTSRN